MTTDNQIPIAEEQAIPPDPLTLVRRFVTELQQVTAKLRANRPDWLPQVMDHKLFHLAKKQADRFLPDPDSGSVLGELRRAIEEEGLDEEALKGVWYMAQYSLNHQKDMVKRRFTGDYETDEWGTDWEFIETVRPFFTFLYNTYWRVETTGLEHIPEYGRALIVGNHSGPSPFSSSMVMTAVLNEHESQRLVRSLYGVWLPAFPLITPIFDRLGQSLDRKENGIRLLEQDELAAVYPEGKRGLGKLFNQRHKLAHFGRGDFVRMALATQAPIIPVTIIGGEETHITMGQSRLLAKATRLPHFPLTLRFPWLGPLGIIPLPSKWHIDFGDPIAMDDFDVEAANNDVLVAKITSLVRNNIQTNIYKQLAQ